MGIHFTGGNLLIILVLVLIVIAFQAVLSLQNSKAPGLILPVLFLAIGLALSLASLNALPPEVAVSPLSYGGTLLVGILPALILFLAYLICRKRVKARQSRQRRAGQK